MSDPLFVREASNLAHGFVRMMAQRDAATAEHLEATASLTERLAGALQLPAATIFHATIAARLHDIGKIAISLAILNKPTQLDVGEWSEMRFHPIYGSSTIQCFDPLRAVAPIVRAHHERIDGMGYPDRLSGADIPIEARIIAIADAFHAMTSERPYALTRLPQQALEEIERCSGSQFDPEVVDVFLQMMRYRGRRLIGQRSA
jgi:two-component system, cell cycle response regulator